MSEKNIMIVDTVEALEKRIEEVREAQRIFSTYSQEQVDKIFAAAALAANKARIPLAKQAVAETGMGIVEDKVIKNHYASEYIYNAYKDTKTCGVIEEDSAYGIKRIAEPIGVVAAVIPTTNPTSTAIFKTLICLKTRNGIIISPHPRAKESTIAAANVAPGDIKYKDLNGDGLINEYDMTYENGLNSTNPELVYGFGLNLEYKGFFAGIFFQGVGKTTVNLMSNSNYFMPFIRGVEGGSARMEALSHWSADNPYNQDVLYPRIHAAKFDHNIEKSTWWYRDGSFLRLKNVEFGYEFSKDMIKKMRMTNLRLYVQGTNLAVWDNIKLWDPELGNSNSGAKYPLGATWTVGLEVSF